MPGDAELDGKVDVNDLTIVLTHYGQTGMTWTTGDFQGDGKVDVNDLTIVLSRYGQSLGSSAAAVAAAPRAFDLADARHRAGGCDLAARCDADYSRLGATAAQVRSHNPKRQRVRIITRSVSEADSLRKASLTLRVTIG